MRLVDIEARNAGTLEARQQHPEGIDIQNHPDLEFFGYYEVDIFECPTFLMFTNNDCPRGWDILFSRHFEPQSMKLWCRMARTATGIVDIGAHVGTYSLAAAALRNDINIHAFEPNPYAFSRLRMHKTINSFDNIVEYIVAVSDTTKLSKFRWVKKKSLQISSGGTLMKRDDAGTESTIVQTTALDGTGIASILGDRPLLKIDVEGAEAQTFRGIQEIIALKPDIILETFSQSSCDAINEMIKPLGYSVYHILEKERSMVPREGLAPCTVDLNGNFNQLLTTRSPTEVAELAAQ
tara:strand:- start:1549 stop:2430 length:882 start_codon:yes stop_codon:yes gene_type:complete